MLDDKELIEDAIDVNEESKRLGGLSPFMTIFVLSLGPLISQLSSSYYSIMDTKMVSEALGTKALSAIGLAFIPQYIVHGFGLFIYVSITVKISYLHGKKASGSIFEVVIDVFKLCLCLAILVPILILPLSFPIIKWLGASTETTWRSLSYLYPITFGFIFTALFNLLLGVLQANGLSVQFGIVNLITNLIKICVCNPIFLNRLKFDVYGSSLSVIVAEMLVIPFIFLYSRKKGIIPQNFNYFGNLLSFSSESKSAIRTGFSALIIQVALTIPSGIIQKLLSLSSHSIGVSTEVMGVWHIMARVYHIVTSVTSAFVSGFLPAASFAFGSEDYSRLGTLFLITNVLGIIWSGTTGAIFAFAPEKACALWTKDHTLSNWIIKMVPPSVYTAFLTPVRACVSGLLQSMKQPNKASWLNLVGQLVLVPLIGALIYISNSKSPEAITWSYVWSDSLTFLLALVFLVDPLRKILS